jgi:hypothetical protein
VADLLGEGYEQSPTPGPVRDGVGADLASRWPLGTVRELDLHVTPHVTLPWAAAVVAEVLLPEPYGLTQVVVPAPPAFLDQLSDTDRVRTGLIP